MVHSPAPNSVSKTTRADSNRSRSGGGSVHRKRWGRGFVHCASQARMLSSMVAVRTPPNSWAVLTVRPPGAARRAASPTRPAPRLQRSASGIAQVGEVLLNPEAPDNFCRPWSRSRKSPRSAGGDRRTGARSPSAFGPAVPSMILARPYSYPHGSIVQSKRSQPGPHPLDQLDRAPSALLRCHRRDPLFGRGVVRGRIHKWIVQNILAQVRGRFRRCAGCRGYGGVGLSGSSRALHDCSLPHLGHSSPRARTDFDCPLA
jgi:hypothetical protein